MNKTLGLTLCMAVAGYLGACALLFLKQRSLIYYRPQRAAFPAPQVAPGRALPPRAPEAAHHRRKRAQYGAQCSPAYMAALHWAR